MIITKLALPVLLFSVLGLTACGETDTAQSENNANEHSVEIDLAKVQAVRSQLSVSGTLEAANTVRLYNEISGVIRKLPLRQGDRAKKGQLLVAIDDSLIQAELDKASALRAQAELDYERMKKLKPRQLASDEEIARSATALDIAIAEEKLQRARLALTHMRAAYDGVISERFFEPGDVVATHSHILTLIDPASVYLKLQVAESWIPRLHQGDKVSVSIDALGDALYPARISRIYPAIDPGTRKGGVEIELLPIPGGASVGQLARVQLETRASEQLVIATRAVHHDTQGAYVYLIDAQSKAQKTYVSKGLQHGELLEILSGLSAGDRIVIKGFIGLRDDKLVKIYSPGSTPVSTADTL